MTSAPGPHDRATSPDTTRPRQPVHAQFQALRGEPGPTVTELPYVSAGSARRQRRAYLALRAVITSRRAVYQDCRAPTHTDPAGEQRRARRGLSVSKRRCHGVAVRAVSGAVSLMMRPDLIPIQLGLVLCCAAAAQAVVVTPSRQRTCDHAWLRRSRRCGEGHTADSTGGVVATDGWIGADGETTPPSAFSETTW